MTLYLLYKLGFFLTGALPLRASYAMAVLLADLVFFSSATDRNAVIENMKVVLGPSADDKLLRSTAREVFRNFAKYLVDFFRFGTLGADFAEKMVEVDDASNIDKARKSGKGAILLSAHIGNWELGGAVIAMIGYPISGVVLPHSNKRINDIFTRQRLIGNMRPIEMGSALKGCYKVLKANEVLALLGDRDFTKSGIPVNFFGRKTTMPKGPASFCYRMGSPIVPTALIRMKDDRFRFIIEEPIYCPEGLDEETAIEHLTAKCSAVIEKWVRRYPSQWFNFRKMWSADGKESLRPDTVI